MTRTELLVVGGGPAGLAAAIEAARAGVQVLVVDDNIQPGGQIYRQLPREFIGSRAGEQERDVRSGRALIAHAQAAGVRFRLGCTAWGMFDTGVMEVVDATGADRVHTEQIVIAAGAHDRPVPVPGWTLPGVFTVGGAQALLKGQRILPGRRMLLAGVGPLLLVVASQLSKAGVELVGVAEPVPMWTGLTILPALAREWPLLADGMRYRAALKRNGVPWFSRTILTRIEGTDAVTAAVISSVDCEWRPIGGSEQRFEVDAVAMGYGLLPSIELPRLCGCAVQYDALARTWRPVRSAQFESSVPGIFLVGDGAGVAGVIVAIEEGRVAGLAIATQLGKLPASEAMQKSAPHMKRLAALGRVRAALDHAYALRQGVFELGHGETMVCRCEEVTFDDLEEAVQDGADNPTILKSFTRCGMGPCQGRMCAATTAEWLAARTGREISTVPLTPAAPPAKPVVTLEALVST